MSSSYLTVGGHVVPDYRRLLIALVCMLLPICGWSNDEPLALTGVTGNVIGNSTLITLDLNRAPTWREVSMHSRGNLLELKLPNTTTSSAGKFHPVNSPHVLKLLPLQLDAQTTSLRIFASTEGKLLQQATSVEVAGKQIIVFVDHSKIKPILPNKQLPAQAPSSSSWVGKIQLAAIALVAMLTLLLGIFGLRRLFVWQASRAHDNHSPVLRQIGQLSLTSQQQLALIEVYGQRLLFAVSKRGIKLLTRNDFSPLDDRQSNMPPLPSQSPQLDNDIYLNQNNLTAQKSMQRSQQHYRNTLPRHSSEHHTEQNGMPKDVASG